MRSTCPANKNDMDSPTRSKSYTKIWEDGVLQELFKALKKITKLHKQATDAQIDARQRRRRAGFQRRNVWMRDAAFMKEVQRLLAQQHISEFEGLLELAEECQKARDELGPLEEEGTQAEREIEGTIWRLQKTEVSILEQVRPQLSWIEEVASAPLSVVSSQWQSNSEEERSDLGINRESLDLKNLDSQGLAVTDQTTHDTSDAIRPQCHYSDVREPLLLGIGAHEAVQADRSALNWSSRMVIEEFAEDLTSPRSESLSYMAKSNESLLWQDRFDPSSDRVSNWLLDTTLLSRLEACTLLNNFDLRSSKVPSDFGHSPIVFWELMEATIRRLTAGNLVPARAFAAHSLQTKNPGPQTSISEPSPDTGTLL